MQRGFLPPCFRLCREALIVVFPWLWCGVVCGVVLLLGIATTAIRGSVRGVLGSDCIALVREWSAIVWGWLFLLVLGLRMVVWDGGGVLLWSKLVLVGGVVVV